MNTIRIFENNYIDAPTMDTRLTPKWPQKHPKATHSNFESCAGDWPLLGRVTTSWNPTYLLGVHFCLNLGHFIGVENNLCYIWALLP